MFTFTHDTTDPTFSGSPDFSSVGLDVGDDAPVIPAISCSDTNIDGNTAGFLGTVNTSTAGSYMITFTCTDKSQNRVQDTKLYKVIDPINISITSDNPYSSSFGKFGNTVTVEFDLATGSTFTGSVGLDAESERRTYSTVDNTGKLIKYLTGNEGVENEDTLLSFSLVITDSDGVVRTYTEVQGTGDTTSVTVDFVRSVNPTNISIAHNGDTTNAEIGDTVTVTFVTSADATETTGTIDDEDAEFALSGTSGTLKLTLSGDETQDTALTFSFQIIDRVGNSNNVDYAAVSGSGGSTSVIFEIPDNVNPVVTYVGATSVSIDQYDTFTLPTMVCTDNVDVIKNILPPGTLDTSVAGIVTFDYKCSDAAGNESAIFPYTVNVISVDVVGVTITPEIVTSFGDSGTIVSYPVEDGLTNKANFDFRVTFDRAVSGFDTLDLTTTNMSPGSITAVNAKEYIVSSSGFVEGTVTFTILGNVDGTHNGVANAPYILEFIYDATKPEFSNYDLDSRSITLGSTFTPYNNITCSDANGNVDATVYSNNVDTDTLTDETSNYLVTYQCTDAAGNNSDLAFQNVHVNAVDHREQPSSDRDLGIPYFPTPPITVELKSSNIINNLVGIGTIVFEANFSEPVSGFTVEDIGSSYRDPNFISEVCRPHWVDCYDNTERNVNVISVEENPLYADHTRYLITVDPIGTENMYVLVNQRSVFGIANPEHSNQGSIQLGFSRDSTDPVYAEPASITILKNSESFSSDLLCTDDSGILLNSAQGTVSVDIPGIYNVNYTCEDYFGNSATKTVVYTVVEPAISAVISHDTHDSSFKTNQRDITFNVVFSEAVSGFTSNDFILNDNVSVSSVTHTNIGSPDNINYVVVVRTSNTAGDSYVAVRANSVSVHGSSHDSNHPSNTFSFTINNDDPVFSGPTSVELKQNHAFVNSVTCNDALDIDAGVITHEPVVVNIAILGPVDVVYTCTDTFGNTADKTVAYSVVLAPPVFTVLPTNLDIKQNSLFVHSVRCHDPLGINEGKITHDPVNVDTSIVGALPVTFTCTDSFGNFELEFVLYNVVFDTPPVITTTGGHILDNTVVVYGTAVPGFTIKLFNNGEEANSCKDGLDASDVYICNPIAIDADIDGNWEGRIHLGYWTGNNIITAQAIDYTTESDGTFTTTYSNPSNEVTFDHAIPQLTGFTQNGIFTELGSSQLIKTISLLSLDPITLHGIVPYPDQIIGVYHKDAINNVDDNLGYVTDFEAGEFDFTFTPNNFDNFIMIASLALLENGERSLYWFNVAASYTNFKDTGAIAISSDLQTKLKISGVPFLSYADLGFANTPGLVVPLPFFDDTTDQAISSLQFPNLASYQGARVNDAHALAIMAHGASPLKAASDTSNNRINFVEAFTTYSPDTESCPCEIKIQLNADSALISSVLDELKLFHFADGRWQTLDTTVSGDVLSATVSFVEQGSFAIGLQTSEGLSEPKKSDNDDWARAPTFGSNHLTYQQQVDYGFTFNTQKVMVQNNYYTDIDKISANVGTNTATIKTFAQDPLRTVSLYLGIPTKTYAGDAEVKIELLISQSNTAASGYIIKQINYHQDEPLVDESNTSTTINKVRCNDTDSMKNCHSFTISFSVMNPLMYDYTAISASDVFGRSQTTFINDGIEFSGEQMSEPKTHSILYRLTNQPGILSYDLTQTDMLNNIWEDQHGSTWTYNMFDTWKQLSDSTLLQPTR